MSHWGRVSFVSSEKQCQIKQSSVIKVRKSEKARSVASLNAVFGHFLVFVQFLENLSLKVEFCWGGFIAG